MPSKFEDKLNDVAGDVKKYKGEYAKLTPEVKSRSNNYDNAVKMIYEAQDQIKALKDDLKKGKLKAADEMKKWQANYPKIFARLKPASDEVAKLKKSLAELSKDVDEAKKEADKLNKDAARSAMEDAKTAAATLKTTLADLKALQDGIGKQEDVLSGLPKEPNGVFV